MLSTISSREFNQDVGRAKRAAQDGPVFITDRGKPAHVLLSIHEYRRLTESTRKIADILAVPPEEYFDWDPPRVRIQSRPAEFD